VALDHRASEQEYTGFGWLESIHPEDRERVERDWARVRPDRQDLSTTGTGSAPRRLVPALRRARGPIERDGKIVEWSAPAAT